MVCQMLIRSWVESFSILPIVLISFLKTIRIYFYLHFIHYDIRFLSLSVETGS